MILEPEAAVASHDNHRVRHTILHAALIHKLRELAMNVTTHHDALRLREIKHIHVIINPGIINYLQR